MKILLVLIAGFLFASAQITEVSFRSYPDNDVTKCIFVMELINGDYGGSGEAETITTASTGFVGYVEVFHGKDESNPVEGNKDLSCTYTLASKGIGSVPEEFHISEGGCTIYDDYEEEISEVLSGEMFVERYDNGVDGWSEKFIITVTGDNDQWDGWLDESKADDFQVCFTQLSEDGWDYEGLCTYTALTPTQLGCGSEFDSSLVVMSYLSASVISMF